MRYPTGGVKGLTGVRETLLARSVGCKNSSWLLVHRNAGASLKPCYPYRHDFLVESIDYKQQSYPQIPITQGQVRPKNTSHDKV